MALKSKTNEIEESVVEQVSFDDLEFEAEYDENDGYSTLSGKEQTNVQELDKLSTYDFDVGDDITGYPEISHFKNDDRKSDSLRVRLINGDEFIDLYVNMPKPDELGYITNIKKGFDYYRTCFDFIYSILRWKDESNVIDKSGEEINVFKKVNIINFAKFVDQKENIGVRLIEGNTDSEYNSWISYKME